MPARRIRPSARARTPAGTGEHHGAPARRRRPAVRRGAGGHAHHPRAHGRTHRRRRGSRAPRPAPRQGAGRARQSARPARQRELRAQRAHCGRHHRARARRRARAHRKLLELAARAGAGTAGAVNAVSAADTDAATLGTVLGTLETVILGKPGQIRLCLACLMARGHLLIEDVPGVGKTTLAHALAHVLGLAWQRVQFTSDLLPADIIGVSVFDRASQQFHFRRGPIFTQLLLADEVNRASPRTQSALLEAMEERQVSADGTTYPLPEPFFVVATQNPHEQLGTFALPESQLARFIMRVTLGYPDAVHERELLRGGERRELLPGIAAALDNG